MSVVVSCSGKFHAFALAEQLQKHGLLASLYTTYAWQKNIFLRYVARRQDKENIDPRFIHTNIPIAVLLKSTQKKFVCNELFDSWVAGKIKTQADNFKTFIGWSGMSLYSIRAAKALAKTTILERGSSHILFQNKILKEEYLKFGIDFSIDSRVIEKELEEYELCDYISIPSTFVKKSFIENGVKPEKLILNPYGASQIFQPKKRVRQSDKFRILYLGGLTIQKGMIYLFEALKNLPIRLEEFEVWFIGQVSSELRGLVNQYRQENWHFMGHVSHYELPELITQCDLAVQPSLQEGLSMVIPQILSCGVPVIATTNTGGIDIINDEETGFIVPVRSPTLIAEKILYLFEDRKKLSHMKSAASKSVQTGFTWDDYGDRYVSFITFHSFAKDDK